MAFRRNKKVGPVRLTVSKQGLTGSVGAGGLRYQFVGGSKGRGRKRAAAEPSGDILSTLATVIGGFGLLLASLSSWALCLVSAARQAM